MLRNYNSRDGPKLEEESHLATCAKLEEESHLATCPKLEEESHLATCPKLKENFQHRLPLGYLP